MKTKTKTIAAPGVADNVLVGGSAGKRLLIHRIIMSCSGSDATLTISDHVQGEDSDLIKVEQSRGYMLEYGQSGYRMAEGNNLIANGGSSTQNTIVTIYYSEVTV